MGTVAFQVKRRGIWYAVTHRGVRTRGKVMTPYAAELYRTLPSKKPSDLAPVLQAPMPGLLVKLTVEPGQSVKEGEELAVIEAMKMENILRAPHDGVIGSIRARLGESLSVDQVILEFE